MKMVLSWIFGCGAMISLFAAYQFNRRKGLLTCKLCADICWTFHYFFLGAYGGMIPNMVGIFREIIFSHRETWRFANRKIWIAVFLAANWTLGIFTLSRPVNLLPIVASSFVTLSLWFKNPRLTKLITVPVCLTFLVYDVIIGSYIGIASESISILSVSVNLIQAYFYKHKKEKPTK